MRFRALLLAILFGAATFVPVAAAATHRSRVKKARRVKAKRAKSRAKARRVAKHRRTV